MGVVIVNLQNFSFLLSVILLFLSPCAHTNNFKGDYEGEHINPSTAPFIDSPLCDIGKSKQPRRRIPIYRGYRRPFSKACVIDFGVMITFRVQVVYPRVT